MVRRQRWPNLLTGITKNDDGHDQPMSRTLRTIATDSIHVSRRHHCAFVTHMTTDQDTLLTVSGSRTRIYDGTGRH